MKVAILSESETRSVQKKKGPFCELFISFKMFYVFLSRHATCIRFCTCTRIEEFDKIYYSNAIIMLASSFDYIYVLIADIVVLQLCKIVNAMQ